jgi:hypothetical protein
MMMKKVAIAVGIAFLMSGVAYAKPDSVPGVGCPVCHDGPPPKKVLTAKAKEWFEKVKDVSKCKDCHAKGEGGKMTSKAAK